MFYKGLGHGLRISLILWVLIFIGIAHAQQIEVKQETIDTLVEMGVDDPAAYLDNIADRHENQKIEREWNKLTIKEKQDKLKEPVEILKDEPIE